MHDLTILGTPYRQVYAFDAEREAEVPFDPEIRRAELKPEADQDLAVVPPPKAIRPWPALDDTDAPVTLATEAAMPAEHLWPHGWAVENIAARVRAAVPTLATYLASRSLISGVLAPGFAATLAKTTSPISTM